MDSIIEFFEPIIVQAEEILKWYNFCLMHGSTAIHDPVPIPPSVTVSTSNAGINSISFVFRCCWIISTLLLVPA